MLIKITLELGWSVGLIDWSVVRETRTIDVAGTTLQTTTICDVTPIHSTVLYLNT